MWKLAVDDDENNRTIVNLVRDEYTVGRAEVATIRLTERNISRQHAKFVRNGEGWLVHDQGSYNGCFVNGVRVEGQHRINTGDIIQLGDYRLELYDDSIGIEPDKTPAQVRSRVEPPGRLLVLEGPGAGTEYALATGTTLIGRGEECDITLNDTSVSRTHAAIQRAGAGFEVFDRGSSNGLRVNGADVDRANLSGDDVIELGDVRLRFVMGQESIAAMENELAALQRSVPSTSKSRTPLFASIGVALALVVGLLFAFSGSDDAETVATAEESVSPLHQTLEEARKLMEQGDLEGAHKKATNIPKASNLRQSETFKNIQRSWADDLFKQADATDDESEKRSLLDRIAKAPGVDPSRRRRAAEAIAVLGSDRTELDELPSAKEATAARRKPAARAPVVNVADNAEEKQRAKSSSTKSFAARSTLTSTSKAPQQRPVAPPPTESEKEKIVRDAPF